MKSTSALVAFAMAVAAAGVAPSMPAPSPSPQPLKTIVRLRSSALCNALHSLVLPLAAVQYKNAQLLAQIAAQSTAYTRSMDSRFEGRPHSARRRHRHRRNANARESFDDRQAPCAIVEG